MQKRRSPHWGFLLTLYLLVMVAPLALAYAQGLQRRVWNDELASGLAMVAFAMLFMELLSSGRFQFVTGRLHQNVTMRHHKWAALVLSGFVLLHPFLYSSPPAFPPVDDPTHLQHLGLTAASILTGWGAWLLLFVLIIVALGRKYIPYSYEMWRLTHALGAAVIIGLVLHHALSAGRYSQDPALTAFWVALAVLGGLSYLYVFLLLPLRMLRRPFRLVSKERRGEGKWQLTFEPEGFEPKHFHKGQFVWLMFDSPFSIQEHPFSIASDPAELPKISFFIVERGDWTKKVEAAQIGARAYLNGPYG